MIVRTAPSLFVTALLGCSSTPSAPALLPDVPAQAVDATAPIDAPVDATTAHDASERADAVTPSTDTGPRSLRVLFVGNSYTFYNDLPALIVRIGAAASRAGRGPAVEAESVTVGGASLRAHWDADNAPTRLRTMPWDAVVLQGQSVEPVLNFSEFRAYAGRFAALASERAVQTVWFATWPRRAGDALYAQSWSGGTPEVFGMRLHAAYARVAAEAMGRVAPVGNAWMAALRARPATPLFDADGSHPSPTGSWLAACVLYRALTGVAAPAESESAVTGVDAADVTALRTLAASAE